MLRYKCIACLVTNSVFKGLIMNNYMSIADWVTK
jgi:nitrate reductase cytochrome c-type subunit